MKLSTETKSIILGAVIYLLFLVALVIAVLSFMGCKKHLEQPITETQGSNYINWNTGYSNYADANLSPDSLLLTISGKNRNINVILSTPEPIKAANYTELNSSIQVVLQGVYDTFYYGGMIEFTRFDSIIEGKFISVDGWVYYNDSAFTAEHLLGDITGTFKIQ